MFRFSSLLSLAAGFTLFLAALPLASLKAASNPGNGADGGNWLVYIEQGADARKVAESLGATYVGPLENVTGYHRIQFFQTLQSRDPDTDLDQVVRSKLKAESQIIDYEEDELLVRYPRSFVPDDPRFPEQWHLENAGQSGGLPFADIRVRPVWDSGLSGEGVTVAIVDEGTQFRHPDLLPNWLEGSGYDYNGNDSDPSPSGSDDRHGTAVAGITLAASNSEGGLGVAYRSQLVPLRLIAGSFRRGQEAEALSYQKQVVDIYNNSWGPSDDFGVRYVDTSSVLKSAFAENVVTGRGGRGNIYVWAAGNGGLNGDNSNYDGYNASPYTISVGAVGHDDIRSGFSEPGANLLVVAPSGGRGAGILTTDNTGGSGYAPGNVYENFSGTSAATPIVSGVAALLLESRPDLGWRDVQQILALSASPVDFSNEKWNRNGAGYWVSHEYGFGRVDAEAALKLAEGWSLLGPMQTQVGRFISGIVGGLVIPQDQTVRPTINLSNPIRVQHVQVSVDINHSDWGDLRVELVSPAGTRSVLAEPHANANSSGQPGTWTYLSTHHLGELSQGIWTLEVTDEQTGGSGSLVSWTLEVWGTAIGDNPNLSPTAEDLFIESVAFPVEVNALEGITDPDGDGIELLSVQRPRAGTVESIGDGRFRFTMGASKDGTDQFSVLVSDGRGGILRRFIHVLDPRPVGRNDLYPILAGEPTILPVLSNDLDPDGDVLRLVRLGGGFSGTAIALEDGTIEYTSPPGFTGVDRIQYELTDDSDGSSSGWATVIIQESAEVALEFDGEDDYLIVQSAPTLQTNDRFTLEAWIYPESYGEYVTGFGRIYDRDTLVFFLNGFDHSFYNDQSLVAYFILDNGQGVAANSAPGTLRLNAWQHVALTYDSSNFQAPVRMYVDGVEVSLSYPIQDTSAPRRPISDNRASPLYIGESDSGARAFKGLMTEFRIWSGVRSNADIAARHDERLTGAEPGLRLYLPLDQTLEPVAESTGEVRVSADIFEASRVPLELPWNELENHYTMVQDSGSGWWRERTLGWMYGDLYPWVYLPSLNWVYSGHAAGSDSYLLHRSMNDWGWVQTEPGVYPWFLQLSSGNWLWYLEGSQEPAWFYSSSSASWVSSEERIPAR